MMFPAISLALEKISSKDRDHRYMGTSDLLNELQKESKYDAETEKKLCKVVVQQLDDTSADVSGLAVKCLVPLIKKLDDNRIVEMSEILVSKLIKGKEQQRDAASIALKSIIAGNLSANVVSRLSEILYQNLSNPLNEAGGSIEVKTECLDILAEFMDRFGIEIGNNLERLLDSVLLQLNSPRAMLRKKGIQCLASLASHLPEVLLSKAVGHVIGLLQDKKSKGDVVRTNIHLVGALCRSVGFRFGPHLDTVVPILVEHCYNQPESDAEIREQILQALESFVTCCSRDVSPHVPGILDLSLHYLDHDPNMAEGMDPEEADEDNMDEEMGEYDDEDEDDGFSDDEDMSWKVRRASAKCIAAVSLHRPEMLPTLLQTAAPKLIERFNEREENVKIDVFNTFIDLLRQTGEANRASSLASAARDSAESWLSSDAIPRLVRSLTRQLSAKSLKNRIGSLSVLRELALVQPACLGPSVPQLVPAVCRWSLSEPPSSSSSTLKLEGLSFLRLLLSSLPAATFHGQLDCMLGPTLACSEDRFYRVAAEALRVAALMVKCYAAVEKEAGASAVLAMYGAAKQRLTAQDQDQEVKDSAILFMADLLACLGSHALLRSSLGFSLTLMMDRLKNEMTQLTAVKAFATIADSPLHVDLSSVMDDLITELASFLRKKNRVLRQSSLSTLMSLVGKYHSQIPLAKLLWMLSQVAPQVSDSDLSLSALSLELCCHLLAPATAPSSLGQAVQREVLPKALDLLRSPLLQGQPLKALQRFLVCLGQAPSVGFDSLLTRLLSLWDSSPSPSTPASAPLSRSALNCAALCVASLCVAAGRDKALDVLQSLLQTLSQNVPSAQAGQNANLDTRIQLSLLCLGEIGLAMDLSSLPLSVPPFSLLPSFLASPSEDIQACASCAMGRVAAGNPPFFLPPLLAHLHDCTKFGSAHSKTHYVSLNALKELLSYTSSTEVGGSSSSSPLLPESAVGPILDLVLGQCSSSSTEEGVRNVLAECLGKLALLFPEAAVAVLRAQVGSQEPSTRATMVLALKFCLLDTSHPVDLHIQPHLLTLLLLQDPQLMVRHCSILALSTLAHNKPAMLSPSLPELLPSLYDLMRVREDLIRVLELGPFKVPVDDGLELRKAAFACMDTIIANCYVAGSSAASNASTAQATFQPELFLKPYLVAGLGDVYDVKMPCHLILTKLAHTYGDALLPVLDELVEPLEKTVTGKVKQGAVKQEVDRNNDIIRSALRAVAAISKLPNWGSSSGFRRLMGLLTRPGPLATMYSQLLQEQDSLARLE